MIHSVNYNSPIGDILLAERNGRLFGLWLSGQKRILGQSTDYIIEKETTVLSETKAWLDSYFDGGKPSIKELALSPIGNDFQQLVWKKLCEIPYGETTTYGEIAKDVASCMDKQKMSAQAVGGAVGRNPISIIIPCHRVVGANGSLTGYAGGISLKIKLLTHEGVDMSKLFIPKKGNAL